MEDQDSGSLDERRNAAQVQVQLRVISKEMCD
jgi:hypothetical protein